MLTRRSPKPKIFARVSRGLFSWERLQMPKPFFTPFAVFVTISIILSAIPLVHHAVAQSQENGPKAASKGKLQPAQLQSGGRKRTYLFQLPSDYSSSKRWPLVFALHGTFQDGHDLAEISRLDNFAYRSGIIVVFPNAIGATWDWDGSGDIAFFSAMIDNLEASFSVDASRVYVIGGSQGGFMVFKLACDLAERIAAVASVAATMPVSLSQNCHPTRPLPVLEINGTADLLMPYDGGIKLIGPEMGTRRLSAQASANWWAQTDGCAVAPALDSLPPKTKDGFETRRELYSACREGTEVALYSVVGGGHAWPGGEAFARISFGRTSHDLNADEVIWEFFQAHPLPAPAN
jgi:polyhydroxybutyrate depolymerase